MEDKSKKALKLWGCSAARCCLQEPRWGSSNPVWKGLKCFPPLVGTTSKLSLISRSPKQPAGVRSMDLPTTITLGSRLAEGRAGLGTVPVMLLSEPGPWQQPSRVLACCWLFSTQFAVLSELTCHRHLAPQTKWN